MTELTETRKAIAVRPIAGAIGADIDGVDLSQSLDDATIADIREALLRHRVVSGHYDQPRVVDVVARCIARTQALDEPTPAPAPPE